MQQEPNKLQQLYGLYEESGLLGGAEYELFESADDEQKKQLFDLAASNNILGDVDYDTFSSAWGQKKKTQAIPDSIAAPSDSSDLPLPSVEKGKDDYLADIQNNRNKYYALSADKYQLEKKIESFNDKKNDKGEYVFENDEELNNFNTIVDEYKSLVNEENKIIDNENILLTEYKTKFKDQPEEKKEDLGGVKDWLGKAWNSTIEGISHFSNNFTRGTGLNDEKNMASFIQENKDKYPELYANYQKNIDQRNPALLAFISMPKEKQFEIGDRAEVFRRKKASEEAVDELGVNIDEQISRNIEETFFGGAISGLAKSIPAMALSSATLGMSFFDQSYQDAEQKLVELEDRGMGDISRSDKETYKLINAAASLALERVGLSNVIKGSSLTKKAADHFGSKVFNRIAMEAAEDPTKKITKEGFDRILNEEASEFVKYLKRTGQAGLSEFETGALQNLSTDLTEQGINAINGREIFDSKTAGQIAYDAIYSGGQEMFGGFTMGATLNILNNENPTLDEKNEFIELVSSDKNFDNISKELSKEAKENTIAGRKAKKALEKITEYRKAIDAAPKNLDKKNKVYVVDLLRKKQQLQKEMDSKDDAFKKPFEKRINEINNLLSEVEIPTEQPVQETEAFSETEQKVESEQKPIVSPETSRNYANLTEDSEGNFVFFHKGQKGYDKIKPASGTNKVTGREEAAAIGKVGGVAMYYTQESDQESGVTGDATYAVKIPKEEVYDFNSDPNNYIEEAKRRHDKEHPNKAFDVNTQLAYVTKIAGENGYKMVVSEWQGSSRAQTTEALKPSDVKLRDGNTVTQDFSESFETNREMGYTPEARKNIEGEKAKLFEEIQKLAGDNYSSTEYKMGKLANYKVGDKFVPEFPTQESVDKAITESTVIPQELKDRYEELKTAEELPARSVRSEEFVSKNGVRSKAFKMESAPEGTYLDIELVAGKDGRKLSQEEVIKALPEPPIVVENDGNNLRLRIPNKLSDSQMMDLMKATEQEAIAQVHNKKGVLHAQNEKLLNDYGGAFNPDYFKLPQQPINQEDNAIQERETTEVPSQPEAQPVQEVEGEVRGEREGQEGTQEGRIEDAGQTQEEGVVLKYQETTTPEQFSEVDGGERVFKEAAGVFNKALDRRQGEQVATEDALNYIQKTKAYENANDTQREEMVRAFRNELGIKEKRTPSAKKVLGEDKQKPPTKEYTNTQINRLAEEIDKRGIKEGQRRAKIKEKEFTEAVKDVLKTVPKGEMSTNQAAILSNRAKSVRTPYQLRKFLQYADKVMNDAEYASKLNKAESVQDKIKTFSKQKDKPSNITSFAKEFSVIDPSSVPDIDQYLLYAERVLNLNRKPKVTKNGLEESPMYVSINEIRTEYLDRYKAMTDGDLKQSILDDHNDLVELGVIDSKMTPNELNEIIESIYSEEQDESKSDDRKIKTLKKLVDYKIMEVSEMPTDGLSIKAKEQIDLIKSADLDKIPLSSQKLANLYASLENYVYNGSLNNLSSITADIYSANAHKELSDYFKETGNSPKKWVSKFKNLALGALNMTQILEALRASSEAGALTYEKSALYEMSAKKTNAENRISKVSEEYANRFINRSNKKLTDAVTSVEERTDRMMYGLLSQVPQQDFKEALDYIEQSIDYQLQDSNSNVVEMAEGAKKVFDKKYKNANNINDIKISKESEYILSWFRDKFAEIKPEYFENAEIVHNRTLEESPNYLPFPSRAKQGVESKSSEETLDQPSNLFDKVILPNRSGATNKRKNTFNPKARYMPLDFEAEMFSQYTNQVMDIETSFTIKKIAAFLRNSESVNVFGDRSMQKAFFDRAKEYVNQSFESNEMGATENTVFKMLNYASNLSGRVALGGVDQAAKQFVPVVLNAGVNAGFDNVFDGLVALTNGSGAELISKTPVSRRAYTDQDTKRIYSTIPDASKKKLKNKLKNMFKVTDAAAEKLMMYVIQASDKAGAQASFLAYYKDFRGDNFKGFEQEGKNPNKEALAFADLMINNTQNVNDIDQQARWLRVKNKDYSSLLRKGMFPFVSFRVNQIGDEVVQLSKFKSKGKRWEATKRLGGRIGEQLAFEAIRKGIYMFYGTASSALLYALTGIEATEEEKEDEKFISEKNAYSVGTATALNQLPFYGLSGTTDNIMNKKVNKYYFYHVLDPKEREKYTGYISPRLSDFEKTKKLNRGFLRWSEKAKSPLFVDRPDVDGIDLGALTIGAENHFNGAQSMWDIYHPLMNDKEFVYTSRSGNQTELDLTEEEKQALAIFAIMENSDLFLPNDIAKIATKSKRKLFNKKFREMYGD